MHHAFAPYHQSTDFYGAIALPRLMPPAAERVRTAMRSAKVTQTDLSDAGIVPRSSFHRVLNGEADISDDRLNGLAGFLNVTVDHILAGDQRVPEEFAEVPVYDVEVSAGSGRVPLGEDAVGSWPFPRAWLVRHGDPNNLRLVRVSGDSQEPELRDGDAVMIDVGDPRLREGMHVVRLDDRLLIKRVQIEGASVRLKSANPRYDDVVVNLDTDGDNFAVVGRAVWKSNSL